jgi:hypothetical protein
VKRPVSSGCDTNDVLFLNSSVSSNFALFNSLFAYMVDYIQNSKLKGNTSPKKCVKKTNRAHPMVPLTQLSCCKSLSNLGSTKPSVLSTVLTTYDIEKMPEVISRFLAGI